MRTINPNESMNDSVFKEKCRKISFEQFEILADKQERGNFNSYEATAIALLYMVSQIPDTKGLSTEEREPSNCSFCAKSKQKIIDNGTENVFVDIAGKMITLERQVQYLDMSTPVNSIIGSFPIAYCPVCGRKL